MTEPAIRLRSLSFSYGDRAALQDVNFEVARGELFGLLGPNGGGKTTLFRILSTLLPPGSGEAAIEGIDVHARPAEVRKRIGVVFQSPSLDKKLTVWENLVHQGHLYGLRGAGLTERAEAQLKRFGILDRKNDLVDTLSGGLRRRVELAKGLLHDPNVLLLDEPSTGLDPVARADLRAVLSSLTNDGITIVLTTHLMEEAEVCNRILLLDRGQVVALGKPDDLRAEIGGDVVWFDGADPDRLASDVRQKTDAPTTVVDGRVRVESDRGHELLREVIEALPGRVRSATLAQPSLEDVFFAKTGHLLQEQGSEA